MLNNFISIHFTQNSWNSKSQHNSQNIEDICGQCCQGLLAYIKQKATLEVGSFLLVHFSELIELNSEGNHNMKQDAGNFNHIVNIERFFQIFSGIFASTDVKVDDLMISSEKPDEIENKTKPLDPDIDEDKPEFILKNSWVFQPENKHVFYEQYDIKVQKALGYIAASNSGLHEAKERWQWSQE